MPNYKIRSMHGAPASKGVTLTRGPGTRKLLPGEVVPIEESDSEALELARGKLSGLLELTDEPHTRPLKYADNYEAAASDTVHNKHGTAVETRAAIDNEIEQREAAKVQAQLESTMEGVGDDELPEPVVSR